MKKMFSTIMAAAMLVGVSTSAFAASEVKIAWSRYIGWEPLGLMKDMGIMDKWNKKLGTNVQLVYVSNYVDSITLYSSKQYNGVAVTNMDVLAIAGAGGRRSTTAIVGDYSNGNDGVALLGYNSVADLAGVPVNLVEYSVSHYALARCAQRAGVSMDTFLKTFKTVNTSDSDIPSIVKHASEAGDKVAVVSWNPMLMDVRNTKGVKVVCTSADIPGEIIDMVVVGDEVDAKSKQALVGAWYETLALIKSGDAATLKALASQSGSSVSDVVAQLKTTKLFYTPAEAVAFTTDAKLKTTMRSVVDFSFKAGVYESVKTPDELGVQFSDGSVQGDKANVMLVFDPSAMQGASK